MKLSALLRGRQAWTIVVAPFVFCALVALDSLKPIDIPTVGFLVFCAVVSELLPVALPRHGLRVTMTLPFVAGIAVSAGPAVALVVDVLASLVGGRANRPTGAGTAYRQSIKANAATATICSGTAGLAFLTIASLTTSAHYIAAPILAYAFVYGFTNLAIVLAIRADLLRRSLTREDLKSLKFGAIAVFVYCLLSAAVGLAVHDRATLLLPLFLVPVITMRAALAMHARMLESYYDTVVALMLMLQRAHPYSHGHLERVGRLAERVAIRLGLGKTKSRLVREAAVLHDIGKIAIDERILEKPGKLDDQEFAHVRQHPRFGAMILSECEQFREIVPWILGHHERPDGSGYPGRMIDEDICIESKIIAVADAFDAMVGGPSGIDKRSYRIPMSVDDALIELDRCSGTQFDPQVVSAFRRSVLEAGL